MTYSIDTWRDFQRRILSEFIRINEIENGRLNPSIGRFSDFDITKTIYSETATNRVIEFRFNEYSSNVTCEFLHIFKDYGEDNSLNMLSLELSNTDFDLNLLWEIRKRWLIYLDETDVLEIWFLNLRLP